jgi:hypothetical protein
VFHASGHHWALWTSYSAKHNLQIRKLLRSDLYTKGVTAGGNPRYLISEAMLDEVFTRLCRRLQEYQSSYAGFQLTPKYTAHFKRVFLEGKSTFTASRLELLMIALPSVLRDLIPQEIEFIKLAIKNKQVDVVDGRMPEPPRYSGTPAKSICNERGAAACFPRQNRRGSEVEFPQDALA